MAIATASATFGEYSSKVCGANEDKNVTKLCNNIARTKKAVAIVEKNVCDAPCASHATELEIVKLVAALDVAKLEVRLASHGEDATTAAALSKAMEEDDAKITTLSQAAKRRLASDAATAADASLAPLLEEAKPSEGEVPFQLFLSRRTQRAVHHEKAAIHHQEDMAKRGSEL